MIDHLNERRNFDSYSIQPDRGLQVLGATGTATETIPLLEGGQVPKYLYICYYGGLISNVIEFNPGPDVPPIVTAIVLSIKKDNSVVLSVIGNTVISWRETGDGTSSFTLYPLADF